MGRPFPFYLAVLKKSGAHHTFSGRRHTTQAGKTATGSFAHMEPGRMCEFSYMPPIFFQ